MRIAVVVLSLCFVACKNEEVKQPPPPPQTEPAAVVEGDRKEAYVLAAIELSCAGQKIVDGAKLAQEVADIQKRAGFDAGSWTAMAQEVTKDSEAVRRIAQATCE